MEVKLIKVNHTNINGFYWEDTAVNEVIQNSRNKDIYVVFNRPHYFANNIGFIEKNSLKIKDGFLCADIKLAPSFAEKAKNDTYMSSCYLLPVFQAEVVADLHLRAFKDLTLEYLSLKPVDKSEVDDWRETFKYEDIL